MNCSKSILLLFYSSGCMLRSAKVVSTPFVTKKWEIKYKEKELYLTKNQFKKDLFNKVHLSDKYEKVYLLDLSKKAGFNFGVNRNKTIKFWILALVVS